MNSSEVYPVNSPKLVPSFVCFVDILGFTQLCKEALKSGNGDIFLNRIRFALNQAYERVREKSKGWEGNDRFSIKIFTDNAVVGYPLPNFEIDYGEGELGHIFSTFSEFQIGLAMEGFLVRGGIAYGTHYMDDDIVFGDALLEAIAQDKAGGPPRISLTPSAVEALQHHIGFYGKSGWSPHYQDLLEDYDGTIFLNYLEHAFVAFPEGGIPLDVFADHEDTIVTGLEKYKGVPDIRAKYEWAARYHNFICREFPEKNPVPTGPDADEVHSVAALQAQKLLEYKIDIESLAASPSRIKLKPISPGDTTKEGVSGDAT